MKIAVLSPCFLQFCVYARPATFEISDKEGVFFFFGLLCHYHKHTTLIFMYMYRESY